MKTLEQLLEQDFKPIAKIKGYYDGGPNDKGYLVGYMRVKPEWFEYGTTWGGTIERLKPNDEFKRQFELKFGVPFYDGDSVFFVTEEEHQNELTEAKRTLEITTL